MHVSSTDLEGAAITGKSKMADIGHIVDETESNSATLKTTLGTSQTRFVNIWRLVSEEMR